MNRLDDEVPSSFVKFFTSSQDKREWFSSFFFSGGSRHTSVQGDWSSDVCSSDLMRAGLIRCSRPAMEAVRRWISARASAAISASSAETSSCASASSFSYLWRSPAISTTGAKIGRASRREKGEEQGGGGQVKRNRG